MNKLILYTLSTCKKCHSVKEALIHEGIYFDEILCDDDKNSTKCDNLEIEVDCSFYPMAVITKKVERDRGGYYVYAEEKTIIHFCTKYDDVMIKRKINTDNFAVCALNTTDMLQLIIKNK
jgi:glutaredoxin